MPVEHIHTYLVHPGKGAEKRRIGGTTVGLDGKLFNLLNQIYSRSDRECDIDISFNHAAGGAQQNPCRDLVIDYLQGPNLTRGRKLAERLEGVTTHRSGLGLLFLLAGQGAQEHKLVISRFPADSAILAEEDRRTLSVEFLERVFMKSATAYKAATYSHTSFATGFWTGRAVDKQINSRETQVSEYWISDFLDSDFRTTSAAGTRRLAVALRDAVRKSDDVSVKREIAAAVTLATGLERQRISISSFGERFGLSEPAKLAIAKEVKQQNLLDERFQFNVEEFTRQVAYRSVELDTGGMLTALSSEFDNVFHSQVLDADEQRVRISTEGKIVDDKLRKSK